MVAEIRIYIEGGGDSRATKDELRKGYRKFLNPIYELGRQKGVRCHSPILCGGRGSAFDDFKTAVRSHPDAFNVLLVDAEAPVTATPWTHLKQRDNWENPGVADDHCHLMVQIQEAWLIADRDTLAAYYGQGFNHNSIPSNQNVEQIAKSRVVAALEEASRNTQKGQYRKIRDAARLLERIDPAIVRGKAPHCERLFNVLAERMK